MRRRSEALQVDFYHLTATPVERALPRIAERVVAGGGRLLVVAATAEQREALDRQLWVYAADSFLPHAQAGVGGAGGGGAGGGGAGGGGIGGGGAGGEADADQPVLIAATTEPANGARFVALVDGAWRDAVLDEAPGYERVFHFFGDELVEPARAAWRALAGRDGVERRYWKQDDDGRWSQAA